MALPIDVEVYEGIRYAKWKKNSGEHKRGCVEVEGRHIHSFPHIKRVLNLKKGIERNLGSSDFYVEEKIDGYNLRVVFSGGKTLAFTRSGKVDPFATDRLHNTELRELAERYVICGEMVGNTPYTEPTDNFDFRFYIFDLIDKSGKFLDVEERRSLVSKIENENILNVPNLGRYSINSFEMLKSKIVEMNNEGKEGIVMKSRNKRIKYVFGLNEATQYEKASREAFDFPGGFFSERLLRAALFYEDFGGKAPEINPLKAFREAVREFKEKGFVSKKFRIRVSSRNVWEHIKRGLSESKTIYITEEKILEKGDHIEVSFRKVFKKTTEKIRKWSRGQAYID